MTDNTPLTTDRCPHCPDGLIVMRSAGEHCAQSDADALYGLINGRKP